MCTYSRKEVMGSAMCENVLLTMLSCGWNRANLKNRNCVKKRFSTENITVKRPGTGISPMNWDAVIGGKAVRDFAIDELIEL